MPSLRLFLVIFFCCVHFSLKAFDAIIQIDTQQAKTLPGWNELQQHLFPELAVKTEKKLAAQNIDPEITGFTFILEGDTFDMQLKGPTTDKLEYLLKHKMIHPDWQYRKENGVFHISGKDVPEMTISATETGLRFTNGKIKQKSLLNFQNQKNMIIQGLLLCTDRKDLNPALTDVKLIYIYLYKSGSNIITDLYIRGNDKAADKRILRDLNVYFATVYANASKDIALDTSLLNIYQVSESRGWTKLRVILTPEQAKEFFSQFGNTLKEFLSRTHN